MGVIPRAMDILIVVLFATSLFLLSPLGKPLITQKFVQTAYQTIPPQVSNHTTSNIPKITYFPNGTESLKVNGAITVFSSLVSTVSGEAVRYSVIYKIIEVYEYVDELQWVLDLASVYLFVRILYISARKLNVKSLFIKSFLLNSW